MTFEDFNIVPNSTDPRFIDLVGNTYGELTVRGYLGRNKWGQGEWVCECSCGSFKSYVGRNLKRATTRSCGCLQKSLAAQRTTIHGKTGTPEHKVWLSIINRCTTDRPPTVYNYKHRGITICERWQSFENFLQDMGERPSPAHTIDRVDNNKGYLPDNCRWATTVEQANNKRNNHFLEFDNKRLTYAQWEQEIGLSQYIIAKRIRRGWSVEKTLTTPPLSILRSADKGVSSPPLF